MQALEEAPELGEVGDERAVDGHAVVLQVHDHVHAEWLSGHGDLQVRVAQHHQVEQHPVHPGRVRLQLRRELEEREAGALGRQLRQRPAYAAQQTTVPMGFNHLQGIVQIKLK